jgi:hypothetical protein
MRNHATVISNSIQEAWMSARTGDKSRYQINRKRAVQRRAKIREMVKAVKGGPAQPAKGAK